MVLISFAVLMTGNVCGKASGTEAAVSEDLAAAEVTPACCEAPFIKEALTVP
jgi:hypothetical protein